MIINTDLQGAYKTFTAMIKDILHKWYFVVHTVRLVKFSNPPWMNNKTKNMVRVKNSLHTRVNEGSINAKDAFIKTMSEKARE